MHWVSDILRNLTALVLMSINTSINTHVLNSSQSTFSNVVITSAPLFEMPDLFMVAQRHFVQLKYEALGFEMGYFKLHDP